MRIAALQPSVSIILDRLDALDTLVACTRYCVEAIPALAKRPIIHDSWSCTTEEILDAQPTLAIASIPYRMEALAALLKAGCPVVALAPHTLADVYADIRLLGSIVHRIDAAESLVAEMQQEIAAVRARTSATPTRPLVYCEEWGKPLIHSQHWVAELVEAAGGRFLGEPGSHTSPEAIAAANPDVLLFAWCGAGDRVPLAKVVAQRAWHDLPAVAARRVHCIPDQYLNTPATTLLEGLVAIAGALHPTVFAAHPKIVSLGSLG